jgi:hypothetical protein
LKLKYDALLSNVAFKFNFRRSNLVISCHGLTFFDSRNSIIGSEDLNEAQDSFLTHGDGAEAGAFTPSLISST